MKIEKNKLYNNSEYKAENKNIKKKYKKNVKIRIYI